MLKQFQLLEKKIKLMSYLNVEEQQYGNIIGGFGYSQFGFSFNFNIQQQNFLGSGNTVGIGTQISDYSKNIFFNMKTHITQLME